MKSSLIITISLLALSLPGQAAALSLKSCAAMEDPVERLACYDTLAGRLPADTAPSSTAAFKPVDSVKPSASAVEPAPDAESAFGLEKKKKPKEEKLDELRVKWTKKQKDASGKWIITLDNGQVWHQIDRRFFRFIDPEQRVVIYPGVLGSYFLGEPERKNGIRVERVK